ncbi:MAG: hypothetical protein IIT70_08930 [Clostridia bacterium]|nr:hypothetical protein [Clostridia bacterium]
MRRYKEKRPWVRIIAETMLISCGVLACVSAIPTSFDVAFDLASVIAGTVVSAFIVTLALNRAKKRWWIPCIVFAGLTALFFFVGKESITNGAKLVWFYSTKLLSLTFSFLPTPADPGEIAFPGYCVTEFLIFEATILALLIGVLLIGCGSPVPAIIVPIPAFVVSFIYTDCPPAVFAVAFLVIYWAGLLFGRELLKNKTEEKRAGRSRLLFVLALAGLAALVTVISPQSRYKPIPFSERRAFLDTFGSLGDTLLSRGTNNPVEYNLTGEGERSEDENEAFSVNCSEPGVYLLRTHSYGRYSDNIWHTAQDYTGRWNSMEALGRTQTGERASLCIRYAYMSERVTPYAFVPNDEVTVDESFVRANGRTAYVWTILTGVTDTPAARNGDEDQYYRFAISHYTMPDGSLKEKMLSVYKELYMQLLWDRPFAVRIDHASGGPLDWPAGTASPIPEEWLIGTSSTLPNGWQLSFDPALADAEQSIERAKERPYETALLVAALVRSSAAYSLNPGAYPREVDFVKHFLLESKQGYCVHFASATTALLQAMGVPARYVIGYRADIPEADTWVAVPRKNAHAWTEVYVRGVGWLPVESSAGFPENDQFRHTPVEATPAPSATPAPEYTLPPFIDRPERPTAAPTEEPTARPTRDPNIVPRPGKSRAADLTIIWLSLALAGAAGLWLAVGAIVRRARKRRFEREDARGAVLDMLEYLDSLKIYGAVGPDDPEALANEAAFSNHPMTEEQKQLLELVRKNSAELLRDRPLKRFFLKRIALRL